MSDFLHRLAARSRGEAPVAKPLLRLSFVTGPRLTGEPECDPSFARAMNGWASNNKGGLEPSFESTPSASLKVDGRSGRSSASNAIRMNHSENDPATPLLPAGSNESPHQAQSPKDGLPSQAGEVHGISSNTLPAVRLNQSGLLSQSIEEGLSGPGKTPRITSSGDSRRGTRDEIFHIPPPDVSESRIALTGEIRASVGPDSPSEGTARRPSRESTLAATTVSRIENPSVSFNAGVDLREPSRGAPSVQITIGRVEVRAIFPQAPPAQRSSSVQARPPLTLEEYAKRRNRGER